MPSITIDLPDTTFVSSTQPDTNLSYYPLLYTGTDPSFGTCIGLIQISLPILPVPSVISALLQLTVVVKSGASTSPVVINRVDNAFNIQTVTYYTCPVYTATTSQYNVSNSDLFTSIQIDITGLVNSWLVGTNANNGLALTNIDGVSIVQFGTDNIGYEPYFPRLILTYSSAPSTDSSYGLVYNTGNQIVAADALVPLDHNGHMSEITHQAGSGQVTIAKEGLYLVWFSISGQSANQFVLYQNEAILLSSVNGAASGMNSGTATVNAAVGDVVSLRNFTDNPVTLNNAVGGPQTNVSASIMLLKVGPTVSPDTVLVKVNAAQDTNSMRLAIQDPIINLNLTDFNLLTDYQQQFVLSELLANRPTLGYPTVPDLQIMLDYVVKIAPTHSLDPSNIYVKADSNGNGSIAHPFGDIQQGINAVNDNGTVHVLSGNYIITSTITINKSYVTIIGEKNSVLTQKVLNCMKIDGAGTTIKGLTFICDDGISYTLWVTASYVTIRDNTLNGPVDKLGSIGIFQDNCDAIRIWNNSIHSYIYGIDTTIMGTDLGSIKGNNIYDCRVGIVVNDVYFQILENSWIGSANNVDIWLTDSAPSLYSVTALSESNNNAHIDDSRT